MLAPSVPSAFRHAPATARCTVPVEASCSKNSVHPDGQLISTAVLPLPMLPESMAMRVSPEEIPVGRLRVWLVPAVVVVGGLGVATAGKSPEPAPGRLAKYMFKV